MMTKKTSSPWTSGPKEILKHGLELLQKDTDTNRRLAMIIVDNSVELMIKTFLALPKRVTGLQISRKKFQEIAESFPRLLDALEEYAPKRLDGVNVGEIEWYHRLRNQLYHDGNGLTVDRGKVEIYAELARLLLLRLFDEELQIEVSRDSARLGEFIFRWAKFERGLIYYSEFVADTYGRTPNVLAAARILVEEEKMALELFEKFRRVQEIRNRLVHGHSGQAEPLSPNVLQWLEELDAWLRREDKYYK